MSTLSAISRIYDDLRCSRTIQPLYWDTLEERLLIFCKPSLRLPRIQTRRSKGEYMSQYRHKKAQGVYLDVLENYTRIFLPFLLAVSARACPRIDLVAVSQHLSKQPRIKVNRSTRSILENAAEKVGVFESTNFKRLAELLFVPDDCQTPTPTTGAGTEDSWTYNASNLDAVADIFGERIYSAVESSAGRLIEKAKSSISRITESIRSKFPRNNSEDAIVCLNIGFGSDLIRSLFPTAYRSLFSLETNSREQLVTNSARVLLQQQGPIISATEDRNAYFTIEGASVSAIDSIFGPQICQAIQESQLRKWEIEHSLIRTTDCVTVDICRKQPQYGIIRLRIGFGLGIIIANSLHALPNHL
ncbi:protein hrmA [Aspergillus tanneri]|uniref:Uncharacterized protein n=1 Tax=Aspergillus tanneri TaxID=1220188 RepID=A0A5M9N054_9EURO|nr:uncharacterized protein ATNIH1004_001676 [Aspergillus tanneri]KAA8652771.1 hypothetical protein ATNIH1004_001676 [Aspergillus tanneri]